MKLTAWLARWRRPRPRHGSPSQPLPQSDELDFVSDLQQALLARRVVAPMAILLLLALMLVAGLAWSALAPVEEITQAGAKVIPKSREQVIQSLEGGLLAELKVNEGDVVEPGQMLLRIDPTRAGALYRESHAKLLALSAMVARLHAEAHGGPLLFPAEVRAHAAIVAQETKSYQARRAALEDALSAIAHSRALAMREIALSEPLVARGLMSELELLRMKRQANDLRSQGVERRQRFQAEASAELGRTRLELSQTREGLVGRADVMERTAVQAPVRGVVKNIRVSTIGGVIQPGERIMEIVPLEDQLFVEARVRPSDVAFLRPGLPAVVKVSAYDFSIYGGLKGTVQLISPDTLRDERRAGCSDESYYRVVVQTDSNSLQAAGQRLPIIAGMTATVEIRTGEKTILSYLLKPVFKAREAFRER